MAIVESVGQVLNGWVAALGGIAVVLALSAFGRLYHEVYVRRMLKNILREVKRGKSEKSDDVFPE